MGGSSIVIGPGEGVALKDAERLTGLSASTLRRWHREHGIGRQSSPCAPIALSMPAVAMLQHGDLDALAKLRNGERADPRVRQYLDLYGIA